MILPDTNLLLYATDSRTAYHATARTWWDELLNGREPVLLAWQVVLSYVRIASSSGPSGVAIPASQLLEDVEAWLTRPHVTLIQPKPTHLQAIRSIAEPLDLGGDILNDVHLAALALEYGAIVHSADKDFARFRGVRWVNPLV